MSFKDGRRPRMAIRAKLPEREPEAETEQSMPRKPTNVGTTMTPGVVTMNTKMTKALRRALKKKQKEKEKEERELLEKQKKKQEEEQQRKELREEPSSNATVNGELGTQNAMTSSVVKVSQVNQNEENGEGNQSMKHSTNPKQTTTVGSSYWDYLDDLDEEDLGLKV